MNVLKKVFNMSQPKQIILSLVLGLTVGFIFKEQVAFLRIFGDIFLKMIKMTIAPLIFVTVTHVFCSMQSAGIAGSLLADDKASHVFRGGVISTTLAREL